MLNDMTTMNDFRNALRLLNAEDMESNEDGSDAMTEWLFENFAIDATTDDEWEPLFDGGKVAGVRVVVFGVAVDVKPTN